MDGMQISKPLKCSLFDLATFPYVIAGVIKDSKFAFHLINLKERSTQLLVDVESKFGGFCISAGENAFDFHFSSFKREGETKRPHEYHHRLPFRYDIIEIMRKGSLPFTLRETEVLLDRSKDMEEQLARVQFEKEMLQKKLDKVNKKLAMI